MPRQPPPFPQDPKSSRETIQSRIAETNPNIAKPSSSRELGALAELSRECWGILNGQGCLVAMNSAWQQQLGWSKAELLHQPWMARVHPEELEQTQVAYQTAIKASSYGTSENSSALDPSATIQLDHRFQSHSGDYRWMRWMMHGASQHHCYIVGNPIHQPETANSETEADKEADMREELLVDSLSGQAAQLAQLYRSATSVSALPDFPESYANLFKSLLESLHPNLPYDISGVLLLEEGTNAAPLSPKAIHLFLAKSTTLTPSILDELYQQLLRAFNLLAGDLSQETPLYLHQVNRQGIVIKQKLSIPPLDYGASNHWPSRLLVPLVNHGNDNGQIIGLLFVASQTQDAFVEGNAQLLYSAADQLSLSLQQLQLLWFKTEKRHLHQILNKLPIGILLLDTNYHIFFRNESAQMDLTHLGITERDNRLICIGNRSIQDLLQCSITQPHNREIRATDSPDLIFEVLVKPLVPDNGQGDWMVVLWDVSDRHNAAKETERALETERDLNTTKSRILRTVSHGYRSPLASILGSAQILKMYPNDLEIYRNQHLLQVIEDAARHLNQLVDKMLDIEEIESGRLEFRPIRISLQRFCHPIVEEAKLLRNTNHRVRLKLSANCDFAYLDPSLLRQILTNLLSNAVKYSPKGGKVELQVFCARTTVKFMIMDEGIGIPSKDQKKLFQAFYRASNADFINGSGLGLNITKKFVDLHKGQITFTSREGLGSTFIVTLPSHQAV